MPGNPDLPDICRHLQGKDGRQMAAVAVKLIGSVLVIGLIGLLLEDKFIFQKYE